MYGKKGVVDQIVIGDDVRCNEPVKPCEEDPNQVSVYDNNCTVLYSIEPYNSVLCTTVSLFSHIKVETGSTLSVSSHIIRRIYHKLKLLLYIYIYIHILSIIISRFFS